MNKLYQETLTKAGIRPSIQRIAIYSYLCENPIHPDVENVYNALYPFYPTLSKTTVYNTLKLFEANNIVQSIKIEDDKLRFDAETKEHLHFKCTKCGRIIDLFQDSVIEKETENCKKKLPQGFALSKIQTYLWGICDLCNK